MVVGELVLDCVIPYIQDLNSVSLVSKRFFDIDSKTRKHLTVHVHFAPNPKRVSLRFPNLESLTLKSYLAEGCSSSSIPVTPWIQEISANNFKLLKSLSIRNMLVFAADLKLLAKTRGASLTSLEIWGCKMFSEDGLQDIARCCIHLTCLRLRDNEIQNEYYTPNGKWFHELALHNTVMESLDFEYPFDCYDMEDVTLLANKCSNSLLSLNIFPQPLTNFAQVFKHAKKLEHFGDGSCDEDHDYSAFRFPPNIRGLGIQVLNETAIFPFLLPCLNQLRELYLNPPTCQCYFLERCPSLEVLQTQDICEDKGLEIIGEFCKKLRKLTHHGQATQKGVIAVAQGCPNLEYLELYISDISNEALECVGACLKNLRDFRIDLDVEGGKTYCSLDNGFRAMLMGCKKLERLDVDLSPGILTDVGFGYIGEYGHNLRRLSLGYTGESDLGLLELLKGCQKLRKLKLDGCPFSKQATAIAFSINPCLRYVWLDYRSPHVSVLTRPMLSAQVQEIYYTYGAFVILAISYAIFIGQMRR